MNIQVRYLNLIQKHHCLNNDEESFAGCTANVSLIVDGVLYVANAGDSRTLMCSNGKPVPMSVDHKPDDDLEY